MEKQRDSYFDFLRGIAIAMVVAIHTYAAVDEISLTVLFRQSLNCAVPLFLAISGYFIGKKDLLNKGNYVDFIKKQLPRVHIPMLLWSILWFGLDYIHNGLHLSMLLAFVGGYSVYYFIILIIQYYLLTPIIQKTSLQRALFGASVTTLLGIATFVFLMHVKQLNIPMWLNGSPFILWLIFYVLGVKFSNGLRFRWWYVALAVAFLLLSLGEVCFYSSLGKVAHGIKISSHCYSTFFILIVLSNEVREKFLKIQNFKIARLVSWIGRQSFFIYLGHMFFTQFVNKNSPPHGSLVYKMDNFNFADRAC